MGEEGSQIFEDHMNLKKMDRTEAWSSNSENSFSSISSSDSELAEDASSATTTTTTSTSSSSSSSSSSSGPLYELSEIMAQLPIKRGLSKHYQGKSQSFTSLASVRSIEDLPKKVIPLFNRSKILKSCKSYGWELAGQNNKSYSPKATISKKGSVRNCFLSSLSKRSTRTMVISE
ncbi:hypothetical protein DITRI_Ditri03aG0059300 [Diplodiscus trichospermus]